VFGGQAFVYYTSPKTLLHTNKIHCMYKVYIYYLIVPVLCHLMPLFQLAARQGLHILG